MSYKNDLSWEQREMLQYLEPLVNKAEQERIAKVLQTQAAQNVVSYRRPEDVLLRVADDLLKGRL